MKHLSRKGFAPVIIVVAVAVVAIAGYFFASKQKKITTPPISKEVKKVQEEVLGNCKYDTAFCKYAANGVLALSKGYSVTSETVFDGKKSTSVVKADGKGNMDMTTYTDGKEDGRTIIFDKAMYTKKPSDTVWIEFPPAESGDKTTQGVGFDAESLKTQLKDIVDETKNSLTVKKLGTEKCGTLTCIVFEMKETALNTTTKIWIDTKEYLARKMETVMKEGTTSLTYDYQSFTITKPSPVKQMPSVQQMMKDSGVNVDINKIKDLMKKVPQGEGEISPPVATPNE